VSALTLRPAPGRSPYPRMVLAQTRAEVVLTLRRGESLLLTLVIPLALLGFFTAVPVLPASAGRPVDFLVPGVVALAVMSTAFTGQAIATAYERSYGVLKRLGATPLPRWALLAGKTFAVFVVELVQLALIVGLGGLLGWRPHGSPAAVVLLVLLGTAAFAGLGLLMAGTLRAELTLAAANGLYLVLLLLGGIVFALSGVLETIGRALPSGALAHGLRAVLRDGAALPAADLAILAGWAVAALGAAALTFRWE
jgi:ABC-2 type transport system permease protein